MRNSLGTFPCTDCRKLLSENLIKTQLSEINIYSFKFLNFPRCNIYSSKKYRAYLVSRFWTFRKPDFKTVTQCRNTQILEQVHEKEILHEKGRIKILKYSDLKKKSTFETWTKFLFLMYERNTFRYKIFKRILKKSTNRYRTKH